MESSAIIQLSAFSGLAGALLTQALTGIFQYAGDKRKAHSELKTTYRNKQVEIAESFYYVTGEKIAIIKKNIDYWQNRNESRSEGSLDFLSKEMKKMNSYMEKLDTENWKCSLVGLYFHVSLTNDKIIAFNDRSKKLYLHVLDLADTLKHSLDESKDDLYKLYGTAITEMCQHYEAVCLQMSHDMLLVKTTLLKEISYK
ncbi:hypothetical protein A0256_13365 [Mucilaginibacter sp. PAMC 26640]|nr:hypothetical protein A0256_13365 [Mucilaginibacter sp. PAMC 26640]